MKAREQVYTPDARRVNTCALQNSALPCCCRSVVLLDRDFRFVNKERSMKTGWVKAAAFFCVCMLVAGGLFAQSDLGTITGYVKDPSGGTIAGAKVSIQNKSGVQRQTTTND